MTKENNIYEYKGDNVGTELERGTEYQVVTWGIDNVVLQIAHSVDTVEITKEEFRTHLEWGTLEEKPY